MITLTSSRQHVLLVGRTGKAQVSLFVFRTFESEPKLGYGFRSEFIRGLSLPAATLETCL